MYDIIYIGGGLNYAGAVVASKSGKKVALIEKDLSQLGGVCLHKGCIPSKMFLHYSNIFYQSKSDIFNGKISLDIKQLVAKKTNLLKNVTEIVKRQCSKVDLIEGDAKIIASYKVKIGDEILEAKNIVIGTGSTSFIPNGIEYDKKSIITSDEVLNLLTLPPKIAIYGAGAIALEMASFFATAGVEVTLIYRKEKILKNAHASISLNIQNELGKVGVTFLFNHSIKKAKATHRGVHVVYENDESSYFPMLLVATGRKSNCDVVGCEDIEVENHIKTDIFFETSLKDHYAIGDCNGKLQLAHAARAEVLNVTEKILGKDIDILNLDNIVKFIHTLPMSYAYVGKIKSTLEKEQIKYKETKIGLNQFTYSAYNDANRGMVVIYTDEEDFILGAEILAPNAEELMSIVGMSLVGELDAKEAKKAVFAHPTFSEAVGRAFYKI